MLSCADRVPAAPKRCRGCAGYDGTRLEALMIRTVVANLVAEPALPGAQLAPARTAAE